jgi:hemerythrin superfamily protein
MPLRSTGGAVLASAAVGFLAGLAANPARKLAVQGAEAKAGDWTAILALEHRAIEKTFEALLATQPRETARRHGLTFKLANALNKHALQEENVVYPAIRKRNRDAAGNLVADHAEIKSLLSDLQFGLDRADPQWLATAYTLRDKVVSHARLEEESVFPRIREAMTADENAALTRRMNWEGMKIA